MVNSTTFMGFTVLFAFMLFFGAAVDNHYAKEDRKQQLSFGAFVDKKVDEYDNTRNTAKTHGAQKTLSAHIANKVNYTNNGEKILYLWGDAR
jgi:hypothetical protein